MEGVTESRNQSIFSVATYSLTCRSCPHPAKNILQLGKMLAECQGFLLKALGVENAHR